MTYYTETFLVGAHSFGVPFLTLQTFSPIFLFLPNYHSLHEKRSCCNKSIVYNVLFTNKPYRFLALKFLYALKKIPWKNYVRFLEMELKTYTPLGPKFFFEKIKFKVLHYIQHDLIRQRPWLIKDQTSRFKSFFINQLL